MISLNIVNNPTIFSFFSGSGLLDLGFEHTGFNIDFVNEYHQPFLNAYQFSRKALKLREPQYGYNSTNIEEFLSGREKKSLITLVKSAKKSSEVVGFIGGPPCPDFSIGGKNRGKHGENGKLTNTYVNLINQCKPDFFLFENVKGLWRTKRHRAFYDDMKNELYKNGYILTDRLTNCIEYGAPQDRDRILLFGIHKSLVKNNIKKNLDDEFEWNNNIKYDRDKVLDKSLWPNTSKYRVNSKKGIPKHLNGLHKLTVQHWFEKNDVENHPNAKNHFIPRAGLEKFKTIDEGDDSKKSFKRLHRWRYSPTAAYGNNEVHLHPYKNRRISAAEAMAIQSLPKNFCLPQDMSLTNMFKTIGNGVPYLASIGISKTMLEFLEKVNN